MKKSMLLAVLLLLLTVTGNTGTLSSSGTTLSYTLGVGISAGTEFLYRCDFGSSVLTSPVEIGDFSLTGSSTSQHLSIRSGGNVGDDFVEFRIILGETQLSAGDQLVLDLSQFELNPSSFTVTANVEDDFGEFDTSGIHSVSYAPPVEPETPAEKVPTLTEWGFILTALFILCLGVFSIRKREHLR